MSDNRKYYYLKLKENYFDEDAIVLLESMQDGIPYSNILLKLYLKSLKNGGKLQLDENIPYTAQMIATFTETTAVRPSRKSSPLMSNFSFESMPESSAYFLSVRVSARRKPVRCVPPSMVLMLFT